jgi:hypothetical protein
MCVRCRKDQGVPREEGEGEEEGEGRGERKGNHRVRPFLLKCS